MPQAAIVTCSKKKHLGRMRAADLYAPSALFQQCVAAARERDLPILILSSQYGLISPDDEIDSYEIDLKDFNDEELRAWQSLAESQVAAFVSERGLRKVILYCGKEYREAIEPVLRNHRVVTSPAREWAEIRSRVFDSQP